MRNQVRLQNLLVAKDLSTFSLLEQQINSPVGVFDQGPQVPTGTDLDEYNQWMKTQIEGVGELTFDDPDDARDLAEFAALAGNDETSG